MRSISAPHLLLALVVLAAAVAGIELAASLKGLEIRRGALSLWGLLFALLVAMWVEADSRGRDAVYRPFEFGWLIFVTGLLYLPYYLWRTRGAMGIVWLLGLLCLNWLSALLHGVWLLAS